MIHVRLPEKVRLICPHCREQFELRAGLLHERASLSCPACGESSGVYSMLESRIRRRLYQAVRDEMENRIFALQQSQAENRQI